LWLLSITQQDYNNQWCQLQEMQQGKLPKPLLLKVEMLISPFIHNEVNMDNQKQDYKNKKGTEASICTHTYLTNAYPKGNTARAFLLKPSQLKIKLTTNSSSKMLSF
jgi:hypothetical protein